MTRMKWTWRAKVAAEIGRRGWNRRRVAAKLGYPQRTFNGWLSGESEPRDRESVMLALARLFGWPLAYLLDDSIPYPPDVDEASWERALSALTPEAWEIVQSLGDPEVVRFLARQLQVWRETRGR